MQEKVNLYIPFYSPKFARKLRYESNLEQLRANIELAPQFIPQKVIDHDAQLPLLQTNEPLPPRLPQRQKTPSLAFGRTLEDLAALEENTSENFIPHFVIQIVDHIKNYGNMDILV